MATEGKILTLFEDKEKTKGIFPRTKISAVSDNNGVSLDRILSELQISGDGESLYIGDEYGDTSVVVNADTLHGYTYEQIISLAGGLPVGSVILWDGDKVPTGWELVEEVTLD